MFFQGLKIFFITFQRASEGNCIDPNSDDFVSIRDLAKRFSNLFGSDPIKSREALAIIHK